jgi:hypothetical protein
LSGRWRTRTIERKPLPAALGLQVRCRVVGIESEMPFDPHRHSAEPIAGLLEECPFTALVGLT